MDRELKTEIDGVEYRGTYYIEDGMVTVESDYGSKTARSGAAPQAIALIMLGELVRKNISRKAR